MTLILIHDNTRYTEQEAKKILMKKISWRLLSCNMKLVNTTFGHPPVAKFIVPDWGDKVSWLAGFFNPMPKSTVSPSQGP